MSLSASLTWNFWLLSEIFFTNDFDELKESINPYILAENEKKSFQPFLWKFQIPQFDYFSLILRKLRFSGNILFKSSLVPYCPLDLCKKSKKSSEQILTKRCY